MASYETCFSFFFLLSLSLSLHTQAREIKFFSKYSNSLSPALSPSLAPAPAPESSDVEHGYGLYGRGPVETADVAGEVKNVEAEGLGKKSSRDFVMPNSNEYEKKGMSDTRFLENGKYYYDANNEKSGIGNENEKKEMSGYMEENRDPENEGNGNEAEKKYLVNEKYYSGYVTKGGNGNEKQEMSEYAEVENVFPENKENEDGYETEKEETGEKRYFVNGKYYSGYVTGSKNRNGNEKQGMSEYMEDEYASPENKENENRYHESEEMYPESEGNENGYETEKKEMGQKKYLVNGKYYSGYVTKSGNGNENEKQRMREYAEGENSFPENKGNAYEYENENQQVGEKKYFVNGKYYNGYVTKSGYGDRKSQNYDNYEDSGAFNEYANRHNEDDFYDRNNEYVREGREQKYGEGQNEYSP